MNRFNMFIIIYTLPTSPVTITLSMLFHFDGMKTDIYDNVNDDDEGKNTLFADMVGKLVRCDAFE